MSVGVEPVSHHPGVPRSSGVAGAQVASRAPVFALLALLLVASGVFVPADRSTPAAAGAAAQSSGIAHGRAGAPHATAAPDSPARASALTLRLDPNTASVAELQLLPRIGPTLAERIVAYRTEAAGERPAFRSAADLAAVRGIGPKTVAGLAPHLCFEAAAEAGREAGVRER